MKNTVVIDGKECEVVSINTGQGDTSNSMTRTGGGNLQELHRFWYVLHDVEQNAARLYCEEHFDRESADHKLKEMRMPEWNKSSVKVQLVRVCTVEENRLLDKMREDVQRVLGSLANGNSDLLDFNYIGVSLGCEINQKQTAIGG